MYDQFIPKYIINRPTVSPGHIVTAEEWNNLWQLSVEQGDHVNRGLGGYIDYLNQTLLSADADEFLMVRDDTNESVPLRSVIQDYYTTRGRVEAVETELDSHHDWIMGALEDPETMRLNARNANRLGDQLPAYYAPQSEITRLDGRVDDVAAGAIAAFNHNDISNRTALDAHPITAITGLQSALSVHTNAIDTLDVNIGLLTTGLNTVAGRAHNDWVGRSVAGAHPSTAITHGENTLSAKLNNIDAIIASITGTVGELNHNTLLDRNSADAHVISAITGLQTVLDSKSAEWHTHTTSSITSGVFALSRIPTGTTASTVALGNHTHPYAAAVHGHSVTDVIGLSGELAGKQKNITVSTAQPSGGVNGDIWIVYA